MEPNKTTYKKLGHLPVSTVFPLRLHLSLLVGMFAMYKEKWKYYSTELPLLYLRLLEIWLMLHEHFTFGALFNPEYSNRKQAFAYQERQG